MNEPPPPFPIATPPRRRRRVIVISALILAFAVCEGYCWFQPQYTAIATVEPKPSTTAYNANFTIEQIPVARSKDALLEVVDRLNLIQVHSVHGPTAREEAYRRLDESVEVTVVWNALLRIRASGNDPQLPAAIANATMDVYCEFKLRELRAEIRRWLEGLRESVRTGRIRAAALSGELRAIREREKIVDPDPTNVDPDAPQNQMVEYLRAKVALRRERQIIALLEKEVREEESEETVIPFEPVKVHQRAQPGVSLPDRSLLHNLFPNRL